MRQLSLWKGKRQRGVKAPPPLERGVHIAIADTLQACCTWPWWHHPAGELRTKETGALLKRMGAKAGISDFIFVQPVTGRIHVLELKRRGEKPTEAQSGFQAEIRLCGGVAEWVDNYDAAIVVLKQWGAVPSTWKPQ